MEAPQLGPQPRSAARQDDEQQVRAPLIGQRARELQDETRRRQPAPTGASGDTFARCAPPAAAEQQRRPQPAGAATPPRKDAERRPAPPVAHQPQQQQQQQQQRQQPPPSLTQQQPAESRAQNNCKKMANSADALGPTRCARCPLAGWILGLLMGLVVILLATLGALISLELLDTPDRCSQGDAPFQQQSHRLFATKTLYATAFNYLDRAERSAASGNALNINYNQRQQNSSVQQRARQATNQIQYPKSSIQVPKIFSPLDSLESINGRLSSAEFGCTVRQLHYIGRHAARLPSSKELDKISRHILAIQARINPANPDQAAKQNSERLHPQPLSQPIIRLSSAHGAAQVATTQTTDGTTTATSINSTAGAAATLCSDPLAELKRWTSFASPEQGNLLIETGVRETEAIAARFKSMFPQMFDNNLTKIHLGTTEELRTGQTALVFMKQFENFSLDFCSLADFPSENTADKQRAYEIQHSSCYRSLLKRFSKEKLSFHKLCERLNREELRISHNLNLRSPNRTDFISAAVSKRLKFSQPDKQLTNEETHAIYEICRYESALTGSTSIWCNLFNEKELRFYEYLSDIDDFFNTAYGHADQARSSCLITRDLANAFRMAKKQQTLGQIKPEAHFYFTHSQVIQKVLAASVDLSQDPEYSPSTVLDYLNRGQAPKARQWQTSLFTPFSANIAFTLYSCPKIAASVSSTTESEPSGDQASFSEFDVSTNPFKVVASLNEQPILLEGCSDYACDLSELLYNGRLNAEKSCRMNEICRNKILVT